MMPKRSKLDREERETLESFERGEWASTHPTAAERRNFQKIARASLAKDKRINIRLSSHDLIGIQRRAARKGVPYQALISGLIHQYVEGDLLEATK
jgi:predicted DNA binding CopG/RHH family protein